MRREWGRGGAKKKQSGASIHINRAKERSLDPSIHLQKVRSSASASRRGSHLDFDLDLDLLFLCEASFSSFLSRACLSTSWLESSG